MILVRILCNNEYLKFIHIPKNAGSSIEDIGTKTGMVWGRFDKTTNPKKTNYKCSIWHDPLRYANDSREETFCVIREPIERLISEYKYIYKMNKGNVQTTYKEVEYFTPKILNAWISDVIKKNYHKNGELDCHLIPQADFVYDTDGKKSCDSMLRFEHIESDFDNLMQKKDLGHIKWGAQNSNRSNVKVNLSSDDINDENMEKLKKIYEKDFILYKSSNDIT